MRSARASGSTSWRCRCWACWPGTSASTRCCWCRRCAAPRPCRAACGCRGRSKLGATRLRAAARTRPRCGAFWPMPSPRADRCRRTGWPSCCMPAPPRSPRACWCRCTRAAWPWNTAPAGTAPSSMPTACTRCCQWCCGLRSRCCARCCPAPLIWPTCASRSAPVRTPHAGSICSRSTWRCSCCCRAACWRGDRPGPRDAG